jgi:hypothetical protein
MDHALQIGVLYGPRLGTRWFTISAGAGLGWTWGEKSPTYPTEIFSTWSIPVELQVLISPKAPIWFGVTAFGDLNPECSCVGTLWTLHLKGGCDANR